MNRTLFYLLVLWGTLANADDLELGFDIYLDDQRVGVHQVNVETTDTGQRVQVEAQIDVRFLAIPLFRYRHRADVLWSEGCTAQMTTRTDNNGEQLRIDAQTTADGKFQVETQRGRTLLEGCVRTFAYWNRQLLDSPRLLNTQNGDHERAELARMDDLPLRFAGRELGRQRYILRIDDKPDIQLWYGADDDWVALQTEVGGRTVRYLRQESMQ